MHDSRDTAEGATQMKRLQGQAMSGFLRVVLVLGLPAAIGIGAGRLAMARIGNKA